MVKQLGFLQEGKGNKRDFLSPIKISPFSTEYKVRSLKAKAI